MEVRNMAFKERPYATLTARKGDSASTVIVLRDSQPYGKTNGIYIDGNTSAAVEALIATLEASIDGAINKYACGDGTFVDEDKIIPSDTTGDVATKAFKVSFEQIKDKCTIVVPWHKNSSNVSAIANALKALDYAKEGVATLTVKGVDVAQTF